MKRIVVDASVVAKWYLPEVYGQQALHLLDPSFQILAAGLLCSETENLLFFNSEIKNHERATD